MLISGTGFGGNVDLSVEQNNETVTITLAITRDVLNEYFGIDVIAKYSSMIEKLELELLVKPSVFLQTHSLGFMYNIVYFQICVCFVRNSRIILKIQITFSCS